MIHSFRHLLHPMPWSSCAGADASQKCICREIAHFDRASLQRLFSNTVESPPYIELKDVDNDARLGAGPSKPNEVSRSDVGGEEGRTNLAKGLEMINVCPRLRESSLT